jgi:hypothetical protein
MTEKQKFLRWDLVDNLIFELLINLNPSNKKIEYKIEHIAEVMDVISNILVDKLQLCTEDEFYPD